MCRRIREHSPRTLTVAHTRAKLGQIERDCEAALLGVLDNVRHVQLARSTLIEKHERLGMKGGRSGNLLELGIQLRCIALVGHPWCQSILDEQWCVASSDPDHSPDPDPNSNPSPNPNPNPNPSPSPSPNPSPHQVRPRRAVRQGHVQADATLATADAAGPTRLDLRPVP